jgi:hypothetical protein
MLASSRRGPTIHTHTQERIVHAQQTEKKMVRAKRRIQHKAKWGEATHLKRNKGCRRNHGVVPPRTWKTPRDIREQVHATEVRTQTHDIPMEEEVGHETWVDTDMPETSELADA